MAKSRDDRHNYRTVEVWNPHTSSWMDNARRVRPATAEHLLARLQQFGHTARIVPNIYYAGVFAPQLEPR
jgi:hypothetical protein